MNKYLFLPFLLVLGSCGVIAPPTEIITSTGTEIINVQTGELVATWLEIGTGSLSGSEQISAEIYPFWEMSKYTNCFEWSFSGTSQTYTGELTEEDNSDILYYKEVQSEENICGFAYPVIAKWRKWVYVNGKILTWADADSFRFLSIIPTMGERFGVYADKTHIYMPDIVNSEVVLQRLDIDSESFAFLSLYYVKDKNAIYHFTNLNYTKTEISPESFSMLSDGLIKDARWIWYQGNLIDKIPLDYGSIKLIVERAFLPEFLFVDSTKVYLYNAQLAQSWMFLDLDPKTLKYAGYINGSIDSFPNYIRDARSVYARQYSMDENREDLWTYAQIDLDPRLFSEKYEDLTGVIDGYFTGYTRPNYRVMDPKMDDSLYHFYVVSSTNPIFGSGCITPFYPIIWPSDWNICVTKIANKLYFEKPTTLNLEGYDCQNLNYGAYVWRTLLKDEYKVFETSSNLYDTRKHTAIPEFCIAEDKKVVSGE
jgi:DKNYY family